MGDLLLLNILPLETMAEANDLNLAEAKTLVEEVEKLEKDQNKVTENSDLKEMVDIKVDGKWRITVEGEEDNATKKLNSLCNLLKAIQEIGF